MKFSIITPTHSKKNIPYLIELYESIIKQTNNSWEWVLYLNGGLQEQDIPAIIRNNPKVVTFVDNSDNSKIGYLKHEAFYKSIGEILVEVDHDDMLAPSCLQELDRAFRDPNIGFVYSDSITYRMDKTLRPYNSEHGWVYDKFKWRDQECLSHKHFPPTSHSLAYIWYAPDHVRAWRASVYKGLGGHNTTLNVCDDHELCIRTYLSTEMKYIPLPLYIYRVNSSNTYLERNKEIQETTRNLFNSYIRLLAEKDSKDRKLLNIDIGGGLNPYRNYLTVDVRPEANYVADLNQRIPLEDNSVGVLNAHHILEHLDDQQHIMAEMYRVLAPGGWAFIEVPSTDGRGAFQDPTHVTYWNQNSFLYWTNRKYARFIDNTEIRFQVYKLDDYYPNAEMKARNVLVTCAVLIAVKPESPRYPGLLEI